MKAKPLIPFLCAALLCTASVQVRGQYFSIGIQGNVNEYSGDLNAGQFNFYQFKFPQTGGGIFLQEYLSPSFNLLQSFSYDRVRHQIPSYTKGFDADVYNLNLQLRYKFNNGYIIKEQAVIQPFVLVGGGGAFIDSRPFTGNPGVLSSPGYLAAWRPNLLAGAGINFKINNTISIQLSNILHIPFDDAFDGTVSGNNYDMHLQHNAALVFTFKKGTDSDKDGVKDSRDDCPKTPLGTKVDNRGCPITESIKDTDGDGVPDSRDDCPRTPRGTKVTYFGCPVVVAQPPAAPAVIYTQPEYKPVADSDGDGVPDVTDRCPNTPKGTPVDYFGCPVDGDSDGDGIPNSKDKCPNAYGPISNQGCPVIKEDIKKRLQYAMHNINFETAKHNILKTSHPILDDVVNILNDYPDYSLRIGGHTDAVGGDTYNLQLSQERVEEVKNYFVTKGISAARIEARGYGKSHPIASNTTAAGRAENRRVELDLFLK